MPFRLPLGVSSAIAILCAGLVLVNAGSSSAAIRTFDANGQAIDYGCDGKHPDGQGWVCWNFAPGEPTDRIPDPFLGGDSTPPPVSTASTRRQSRIGRGPVARKADSYIWNYDRTGWYGIGATRVGEVNTTGRVSFNGRQGIVNQGARHNWGPPIRVEMIVDAYDSQLNNTGGTSAIRPTAPSFTTGSVSLPTWNPYFHGAQRFLSYNYYIRSSGVNNPNSVNGTFHAGPIHSPTFYCVNSLGSCYFP
jgi:hypothetical protein